MSLWFTSAVVSTHIWTSSVLQLQLQHWWCVCWAPDLHLQHIWACFHQTVNPPSRLGYKNDQSENEPERSQNEGRHLHVHATVALSSVSAHVPVDQQQWTLVDSSLPFVNLSLNWKPQPHCQLVAWNGHTLGICLECVLLPFLPPSFSSPLYSVSRPDVTLLITLALPLHLVQIHLIFSRPAFCLSSNSSLHSTTNQIVCVTTLIIIFPGQQSHSCLRAFLFNIKLQHLWCSGSFSEGFPSEDEF